MHYLIAESIAFKPHLETGGELALRFRDQGHTVSFAWLGQHLPWSDWHLPWFATLLGCSLARRVMRFQRILIHQQIRVVPPIILSPSSFQEIRHWAYAFDGDSDALRVYKYQGAELGMGALSSLISLTGNSAYAAELDLPRVRRCLLAAVIVYTRTRTLLSTIKPDILITFNGRFATSKPIIEAAAAAGIPALRHERGSTFARYALHTDAVHNYEYIRSRIAKAWLSADPATRDSSAHEFFLRRRNGDGICWYSYTEAQTEGLIPVKSSSKRRLVYFTSSDDEYAAVTDVFTPGPWPNQLQALSALLCVAAKFHDIELVVRLHPHLVKKSSAERKRWLLLAAPNILLVAPGDQIDSYALLDSADIVVTYGSTIGMEAAYAGKPSILIGPCSYAGSEAIYQAHSEHELELLLSMKPIPPKDRKHCLPYGYYFMTFGDLFGYYRPESLSEGTFLGHRLGWDPGWLYLLRRCRPIKAFSRMLLRRR